MTPESDAPWRLLILDRDPADPEWLIAAVTLATDVLPAPAGPGGPLPGLEAGHRVGRQPGRPPHRAEARPGRAHMVGQRAEAAVSRVTIGILAGLRPRWLAAALFGYAAGTSGAVEPSPAA